MQILGFEFELPAEFRVEKISSAGAGSCIDIMGKNAGSLAAALAEQAVAVGFSESKQEAGRIKLERGEQRLLLVHDAEGLTIQTYDPTTLPRARFDGSAVLLDDLRFECGATSIAPLRETYLHDKHLRSGAWRLSGVSAPEVVARVLDTAVTSRSLKRGAVFGPPRGGEEVWSGEAYSKVELVKVHATVESGVVLLEIDLIDNRGHIGRKPSEQ
ncbi:hypothetical protein WMF20_49570 [Sorangium sp. So ce834]|uniref:hypothetical protein n=1 Tax=Sorangium sp. So ce834 TaxID=3133321 RepID=UPI003F620EBE